jgi:signal peptidase I
MPDRTSGWRGSSKSFEQVLQTLRTAARDRAVTLKVKGDSMAPRLTDGEPITVLARRHYWPGDIVAFAADGGEVVVHRVVGFRPSGSGWALVTRGDAVAATDRPVARDRVIGKLAENRRPAPITAVERLQAWRTFAGLGWRWLCSRRRART